MSESQTDTLIGQIISGRYELSSCLDKVGATRVYKVKDLKDSSVKAIKIICKFKNDGLAGFLSQGEQIISQIRHPHLAQLHEVGLVEGVQELESCPYMVLEFLPGRSLYSILNRQGRIELLPALELFIQIGEIAKHLHACGLSNLQISPRKIIVSEEGGQCRASLSDAGLTASICELNLEPGDPGTPFPEDILYMSPEQCAKQTQDHRSDIYSLGCIMYECLVGLPPFLSKSAYEVGRMHVNDEAKPLRMSRDDLNFPLELDLLVLKSLRKIPSQRQQNMSELLEDLEHVKAELSKVPDLSQLSASGQKNSSLFSDYISDLSSSLGLTNQLKAKLALPVITGLLLIFGSILLGMVFNLMNVKALDSSKLADREWQQLDLQAAHDYERGNPASAETRYLKALSIAEKFGKKDRRLLATLLKLQDVYYSQKRFDKADEIEARIKALMADESP